MIHRVASSSSVRSSTARTNTVTESLRVLRATRRSAVKARIQAANLPTSGSTPNKRTHTIVAVDDHGKPLGQTTIGTASKDHFRLVRWAGSADGSVRQE